MLSLSIYIYIYIYTYMYIYIYMYMLRGTSLWTIHPFMTSFMKKTLSANILSDYSFTRWNSFIPRSSISFSVLQW